MLFDVISSIYDYFAEAEDWSMLNVNDGAIFWSFLFKNVRIFFSSCSIFFPSFFTCSEGIVNMKRNSVKFQFGSTSVTRHEWTGKVSGLIFINFNPRNNLVVSSKYLLTNHLT